MKLFFPITLLSVLLFSCQKKIDAPCEAITGDVVESQNALYPFPCHATYFVTNYPVQPGKVPPFQFTKTQYASGRIKTINMLSRANPIHPAFKPQAWEVIGTFTYYANTATLTGTKQLWEYYKTSTGGAGRKSIIKKNISLRFDFDTGQELGEYEGRCRSVYNLNKRAPALDINSWLFGWIKVLSGSDEPTNSFQVYDGSPGGEPSEIFASDFESGTPIPFSKSKHIKIYHTNKPWPNTSYQRLSYQPTQNWISLEYTLLEVMGWLPFGFMDLERSSVSVEFFPYGTSYKVVQSQVYKNHKYDSKGNLISYSYGDNVLQKTTWICK